MRCVKAGRMGTRLRWTTLVFAPWVKPHHHALAHSFLCLLLCLGQMPSLPAVALQIGLATITVGGLWPSTRLPSLPLPYTALQLVFGLLVGFCNVAGGAVAYISGTTAATVGLFDAGLLAGGAGWAATACLPV